jgi:ABC-type protease/lipase transport system fused ATPase/permease subunit
LIRGVAFTLFAGDSLGIVGPSASGKTTLEGQLLGIRVPQAGKVRLDGADIARFDRDLLGSAVGYLPQEVQLFAGSVATNIAPLQKPDPQAVIARRGAGTRFIPRLPEGYDTEIGEALPASGGQRQRITLARALYGDPAGDPREPNANLEEG